jgi:dihydroorotate dehydrogenase
MALHGLRLLSGALHAPPCSPALAVRCAGLKFAHPVGLAAGFDKNGDFVDALGALGFSHLELGTVTPRAQLGNPKPRLFRVRDAEAIINRMGFNNKGVDHLLAALSRSHYRGVRGVSIGKNASTPLENAGEDYLQCFIKVYESADYIAINVSSPNTRGLRQLGTDAGLEKIVVPLMQERLRLAARYGTSKPLLVKISPDVSDEEVDAVAAALRRLAVDGVIATNTTVARPTGIPEQVAAQQGGLSGAPLHGRSLAVIRQLRSALGPDFPIIGVGGILRPSDALATLHAGANLLQIYTGFVYRGPQLLSEILQMLEARAERSKIKPATAVRGG